MKKSKRKRSLRKSKKRSLRRSKKRSSMRKSRKRVRGGGNLFSKSIFTCSEDETEPTNKELVVELFNNIDNVYKDKIKDLKLIGPLGKSYNINFDTQKDMYHFSITTKIGNEHAIINIKNKLTDKVLKNNVITDNVMLFLSQNI